VLFDGDQFSQELQLSGLAVNDRLQWLVGLYYFEEDTAMIDIVDFPRFLITSGATVQNSSTALFGQFTFDLTEKASLTLGARSSDEKLDSIVDDTNQHVRALLIPPAGGFVPFPIPPAAGAIRILPNNVYEADESRTEPYVNFAYRWTDDLMGYVSYSEGFKGGGFTQRIPPFRVVESFGPESAQVVEVGFKWQGADGRARVTGAAFNTAYEDMQVDITTELGGGLANAAEATISGFELEAVVQVTPQFMLSGGLGKLDGQYDSLAPTVTLWTLDDVLPNLPETQVTVSGVYSAPFAAGELTARLDVSYNDDIYTTAQNQVITPNYTLINGSIVYSPNEANWELALLGRNLGDEVYSDWVYLGAEDSIIGMTMEPPREIMAKFTYRF